MIAETIAKALAARRNGAGWMARCPAHDDRDPSLSIRDADGRVLVHCFAGCEQTRVIAALRERGLWEGNQPRSIQPKTQVGVSPKTSDDFADAMTFWNEAIHPKDTPVIPYFLHRKITLPEGAAGEAIRYNPACKFGWRRVPCMIALIRDIKTSVPKAIHRTALDIKGNKIEIDGRDRMMLGPVAGGAVKLTPDSFVTTCLGIGEGLETTLSMRLVREFGAAPVWALLTASQIEKFPTLAGIECLWIAVDNDQNGKGQSAAEKCSARWTAAGREVFRVVSNRVGEDLNDIAQWAGK
jgi:putative DNA primase/helicase